MTGKDLLYKYLDYKYLWSNSDRLNEKPSIIRRQQLNSLLDAFGLSKKHVNPLVQMKYFLSGRKEELNRSQHLNKLSDIQYFEQGEFLNDREYDVNEELIIRAFDKIKELYKNPPESRMNRPIHVGWMFNDLMNFRQEIFKVAYPWGGMDEGFAVGLIYSKYLQSELKKTINENLNKIDETLWLIIDPQKREIDLETIKSEFQYPDVDLEEIDLNWRIENY
ncbi:hypothetical protein [Aquimarina sp. 433]